MIIIKKINTYNVQTLTDRDNETRKIPPARDINPYVETNNREELAIINEIIGDNEHDDNGRPLSITEKKRNEGN